MAKGSGTRKRGGGEGTRWQLIQKPRFNGRDNIFYPWYRLMEGPINIRLYYGGVFVTKKRSKKTSYEKGEDNYYGLALHPDVYEVCYFEFADWIKNKLKYATVGQLWFRMRGCTLYNGRKEIKSDRDIPDFLDSPEPDGWYNLYVTHTNNAEGVNEVGVDSEMDELGEQGEVESGEHGNLMHNIDSPNMGGPPNSIENPRSELDNHNTTSKLPLSSTSILTLSKKKTPSLTTTRVRSKTSCRSKKWAELSVVPTIREEDDVVEETDEDDSDVILSEGDYDDDSDDDLFADNVDEGLDELVNRSLGGTLVISSGQAEQESEAHREDILVGDDVDLNESDEDVRSLDGSDDEKGFHYPVFNPSVDFKGKIKLVLGQKFPSVHVFRKALRYHAVENQYNYYFLHNGAKRVTVYCRNRCQCEWIKYRFVPCTCEAVRKCRFRIHGSKVKGEETFQLKSLNLEHVCGRQHQNNKVTSEYLAERFLDEWRDSPSWKLSEFMKRAKRVTGVELGYYKCYYAKKLAMQMIYGDCDDQYKRVWDYAEAIRKYNPGSTAVVKVVGIENPPPLFQRIYICLQPCKEGFMAGCRPILGVDGCHLRGPYPGICLTAIGKDGNNNIFPVAWSIVEVENAETWAWFLDLLVKDLESVRDSLTWVGQLDDEAPVTYMSDRQKGLLDAFNKVVPNAEIRFCCRHIWANFKKKFPGELFKECFWKAARSSTKWHFDCQMESIKLLSPDAFNYLNEIPAHTWSRHAFSSRSKSGMLLNNCCESFNSVIREARSKPILTMLEWIRRYVMRRCSMKREGLQQLHGKIMPSVMKMLDRASEEVSNCDVSQADVWEFEVDHFTTGETYVVNLAERKCGCYRWELLGIPCYHAYACIYKQRLNVEDYVHEAYHVSTYARTYAPAFHAMPGKHQWPTVNLPQPLPPAIRKMPGRPKLKKRVKEQGEVQEQELVKRDKKKNKCSRCGQEGHYANKCKNQPKPPTILSKGGRPRKNPPPATVHSQPTATATQDSASTSAILTALTTSTAQVQPAATTKRKSTAATTTVTAQPSSSVASRKSVPPRTATTATFATTTTTAPRKSAAPKGIPKPKKHKSMVEVLSSQTSTAAKP